MAKAVTRRYNFRKPYVKFDRELGLRLWLQTGSLNQAARILTEKHGVKNSRGGALRGSALSTMLKRWICWNHERAREIMREYDFELFDVDDDYQWYHYIHKCATGAFRIQNPEFWMWASAHRDVFNKAFEYDYEFVDLYNQFDVERSLRMRRPYKLKHTKNNRR